MVINDYYDRKIDAINEPQRPIPSGTVKIKEALAFMVALIVVGFAFALWISIWCFVVAAISLVITATYLTVGKRSGLPGNFLGQRLRSHPLHLRQFCRHRHRRIKRGLVCIHGFPLQHRQRNHQRHRRHQRRQR